MEQEYKIHASLRNQIYRIALCIGALLFAMNAQIQAQAPPQGDPIETSKGDLVIYPINHATVVMTWNKVTICVDPIGHPSRFQAFGKPDAILITDLHGDHFSTNLLSVLAGNETTIIAPPVVARQLPTNLPARITVLTNGQSGSVRGIPIEAIAAYNVTPDRLKFHEKGRGNGYLLTLGGKRIYLSGDTEPTPEMRALKNIDVAFLCMNLPYTMDIEQAAAVVREIRPRIVYPYHYRGSDLEKFKALVGYDAGVEVRIREWYK